MKRIHGKALAHATSITLALIVVLTLWGELSEEFEDFLKGVTGHHWVTKGIASLVVFAVAYLVLSRTEKDDDDEGAALGALWTAVIGVAVILGFFLWHFLGGE